MWLAIHGHPTEAKGTYCGSVGDIGDVGRQGIRVGVLM